MKNRLLEKMHTCGLDLYSLWLVTLLTRDSLLKPSPPRQLAGSTILLMINSSRKCISKSQNDCMRHYFCTFVGCFFYNRTFSWIPHKLSSQLDGCRDTQTEYYCVFRRSFKFLQNLPTPTEVEFAEDEFILHMEGTAGTQRVVRHIGTTSWPGNQSDQLVHRTFYFLYW
jgi:hypothetical protein